MELFKYLSFFLGLTLVIELIALGILRERRIRVYLLSILMNSFTNISINLFGYYYAFPSIGAYIGIVLALEAIVWVLEGLGYYALLKDKKKSILYTLVCNGSSFALGMLIQALL